MSVLALIDTNVVLDVLCDRASFADDSERLLNLCETDSVDGCLSALSIPNLVYITRKELDLESVENVVRTLETTLAIVDLKASDIKEAAALRWKDFEDALQFVTAKRIEADCVITRNARDFADEGMAVITPHDFLASLSGKLY